MSIMGMSLPPTLTASATFGSVYFLFERIEKLQSPANKRFVAGWMRGLGNAKYDERWNVFYNQIFASVFGVYHFSIKCLFRSISLSIFILGLAISLWWSEHKVLFKLTFLAFEQENGTAWGLAGVFGLACITDYISLLKTRLFVGNFSLIAGLISAPGLVLVDACSTIFLFIIGYIIASSLWLALFTSESFDSGMGYWLSSSLPIRIFQTFSAEPPNSPFPLYLLVICALATSVWLWFYIIATAAVRVFKIGPLLIQFLPKILNIDKYPIRCLGLVIAGISSALVALISIL